MRVLWVVSSWPLHPDGGSYGGVFYKKQALALRRLGVDVDVVLALPNRPGSSRRALIAKKAGLTPLRYFAFPQSTRLGLHHIGLIRPLRRILRDRSADLIHVHKLYPFATACMKVPRDSRPPVIATLHGTDIKRSPKISRFLRRRVVDAARSVDCLIAVGQDLGAVTKSTTGRQPKVIPLGVDFSKDQPIAPRANPTQDADTHGPLKVLFVGNLFEAKGLSIVFRVAEALHPQTVQVTIVGAGPLADACKAHPYVRFLGALPNDRVRELMRQSDLLLLPSESEGLPTVVLEAGAEGLAVAASNIDGCRELLHSGRGILLDRHSVDDWVDTIRELSVSRIDLARFGRRLQEFVRTNYERGHCTRALQEEYWSLLRLGGTGKSRHSRAPSTGQSK